VEKIVKDTKARFIVEHDAKDFSNRLLALVQLRNSPSPLA
jgi:hypothetical protein